MLKTFEIESIWSMLCKLESDQKSHHHNFNCTGKWSYENTDTGPVSADAGPFDFQKCK